MKNLKEHSAAELRFYSKTDLLQIFLFKRTKIQRLLNAGVLPVVKTGKTHVTSDTLLERWLEENVGKGIYY